MRVIPVLDVAGGVAVHARGSAARSAYAPVQSLLSPHAGDVLALAGAYRDALGIDEVYLADLDAIAGAPPTPIAGMLATSGMRVWLDAGVSSAMRARAARETGAWRVVAGLETLASRQALAEIVDVAGRERVAFSLDLRDGRPLVRPDSGLPTDTMALAALARDVGIPSLIVLDLGRVGTGHGVALDILHRLRDLLPDVELLVGGGVRDVTDLEALGRAGAAAALVATALHEGRIGAAEVARVRELGARSQGGGGRGAIP